MLRDDQKQKTSSDLKSWTGCRYLNACQSWKFIPKILWLAVERLKGNEKAAIHVINDPVKTQLQTPKSKEGRFEEENPTIFMICDQTPNPRRLLVVRRDKTQKHKSSYWFLEVLWNKGLHNKLYMKIRGDMFLDRGQNKYDQMVFKGSNLNLTLCTTPPYFPLPFPVLF